MLQLLPRRLRGLTVPAACPRCGSLERQQQLHTSQSALWRTREERRLALHSRDDEFKDRRRSDFRAGESGHQDDNGRRHHARPSYPRRTTNSPQAFRPREYERPPREDRPSSNPYKKQIRPDRRDSLGVFSRPSSKGPEYPAHLQREQVKYPSGISNDDRLKVETKEKIKTAFNLAKELPPLTDEDYRQVYEELLTYDAAPLSPAQTRLALEGSSASIPLLGQASKSAEDRIEELLERLNRRVPNNEVPSTSTKSREAVEEEGESLVTKLMKMRRGDALTIQGVSKSLSSVLETASQEDEEEATLPGDIPETQVSRNISDRGLSNSHANTREKIFHALSRLLKTTSKTSTDSSKLIIGAQPAGAIKLDIATKQEWAALVLEAADDRNLSDVLTTFELMKRAGVALSEELLAASIRLISKDQELVPVLLRYFEQNDIALPLTAHHEVVVGILRNTPPSVPTTKAERYLRALEVHNQPALSKTYAAVIKHIFELRRQTGIRARAWNLYGHMRLVAHPTPSVEVFDAMIYGCSLDDRVSPERALDLFAEMIELGVKPSYNTYLGLIRTCARDKNKESPFYYEALRLLKELLERGFKPERDIFNCILEGSRFRGDLTRAKWIISNMLQLASNSSNPRNTPMTPDINVMQNLFLTAATYRPPNISKAAMKLLETDGEHQEVEQQDETSGSSAQASPSSAAAAAEEEPFQAPSDLQEAEATTSSEYTFEKRSGQQQDVLYGAIEDGQELAYPPPQHPLYRPDIPQTTHQLLDDFKQIMGTLLEVHGLPTDVLETQPQHPTKTASNTDAGLDVSRYADRSAPRYSSGLDEGTQEALRNVPVNTVMCNAYLTLLTAHGRSNMALAFFKTGFPALHVRPSHQTWEIIYETLDSSSRQRDQSVRIQIRNEKASIARELFQEWEEWLMSLLRTKEETPAWFARHIETIYAHAMSIHARAQQVDEGLKILEEFHKRFPPKKIVEAIKKEGTEETTIKTKGPAYLVQLSSFLYPETMDTSFNVASSAQLANQYTGGGKGKIKTILRNPLPKSEINTFNLWGLPPILSYQMIYPLFHRLREEEDDRINRVWKILARYRTALLDALKFKEDMERMGKSAKMERNARKGIIEQPSKHRVVQKSTLPRMSETLAMPETKRTVTGVGESEEPDERV